MLDKIITELSKHLPAEHFLRYDTDLVPGEFLILANYVDEKGNKPKRGELYKIKIPVLKLNAHVRKMRIAYLTGGLVELFNYMNKFFDERRSAEMKIALSKIVNGEQIAFNEEEQDKLFNARKANERLTDSRLKAA